MWQVRPLSSGVSLSKGRNQGKLSLIELIGASSTSEGIASLELREYLCNIETRIKNKKMFLKVLSISNFALVELIRAQMFL